MRTRTAVQYGALAGMVIGCFGVAITPRPGIASILGMMFLAVALPVFIIYLAGRTCDTED